MLPDMLQNRVLQACAKIEMNKKNYFVILGGQLDPLTAINSIHLYNIESAQWTIAPATMFMPAASAANTYSILAHKINVMNENQCDLMFISATALYICKGNYEWTSFDVTAKIDGVRPVAVVGANDVVPCGI